MMLRPVLSLLGVLLFAATAHAQATDCEGMKSIDRRETWKADDLVVPKCIFDGADPPVEWRENEGRSPGINVGSTGGFVVGSRQAPDRPPGRVGANASVGSGMFKFTMKFPPWRGFPCQLPGGKDICGGDNSGGGGGGSGTTVSCAMAAAIAEMGGRQPITGSESMPLSCGGALPLTTYQLTLNPSASGLLATEAGSHNVWSYAASGRSFTQNSGAGARLPTYLCRKNSDGEWVKSVDIPPATAQMITYGSSSRIAVRLQNANPAEVTTPFSNASGEPEKYLIIPVRGSTPQIPGDCADEEVYYRPIDSVTDALLIQSATTPGCEGDASECGSASTTPTATSTCDTVTLDPTSGNTGSSSCEGKTLIAVIDRPNLVYSPGSTASFGSMQGRTAVMATAPATSRIYAQYDTIFYMGAGGQQFTLPDGGELKLRDGSILEMNAGARVRAASRQVLLVGGGTVRTQGGVLVQTIPANTAYSPAADLPYAVRVNRSIELPSGYSLPTQPSPYMQVPISTE